MAKRKTAGVGGGTSASGRRLTDLARAIRDLDRADAPDPVRRAALTDELVTTAEYLAWKFVASRREALGLRCQADRDDLLQYLRIETVAGLARYDGRHAYSTFLITGRWRGAVSAWRRRRDLVRPPAREVDRGVSATVVSLDVPIPGGRRGATRKDRLPDHRAGGRPPDDPADARARVVALKAAMGQIDPNDAHVVRLRYLIREPMSRAAVGALLGVSAERVAQRERRAFGSLRAILEADPAIRADSA